MIVSIHQPGYFPWLGLLDKINKSDLYVILDNVQLNDSAFQNRNLFLDNQNKEHLLTIAISKKNYTNKSIKDIKISNNIWQKKHKKFIYFNYKKHPYFDEIYPLLQCIFEKEYVNLVDLLVDTMKISFEIFGIKTELVFASELNINDELKKEELVIDILKNTNADIYLSGTGAKSYQVEKNFSKNDIELIYQKFTHPIYPQINNSSFNEGLAFVDVAFNIGEKECKKLFGDRI